MRTVFVVLVLFVMPARADSRRPRWSVVPQGKDWYCTTRSDFAMGHCTRAKEDCELISERTGPGENGSTWPECSQQKRAAVFTLRNKLQERWFSIAQPTFEMCKKNRRTWSPEDYDNISDCVGVGER